MSKDPPVFSSRNFVHEEEMTLNLQDAISQAKSEDTDSVHNDETVS